MSRTPPEAPEHESPDDRPGGGAAEPVIRPRRLSPVWLVPLAALIGAAWLAYTTLSQRGPLVTITFETAEGLEVGQTKIKYREIDVGEVERTQVSDDLQRVVVYARLNREFESALTANTRFWIVKPRVGLGGVTGLATLVSGSYIELDPGPSGGEAAASFTGLEEPPPIRSNEPGRSFVLRADDLSAMARGTPVSFRGIDVGQVLGYTLAQDRQSVRVEIFVRAPYDRLVRENSRFWNASSFDVSLGGNGVNVSVNNPLTLLTGGIAFETPVSLEPARQAAEGADFYVYSSYRNFTESAYTRELSLKVYFNSSVRGLSSGSPVELRGIRVGEVVDVGLVYDAARDDFRVPVLLQIQPERVRLDGAARVTRDADAYAFVRRLVRRGLRAQLQTGSLITGDLIVALDFHDGTPASDLTFEDDQAVLPSVPPELETIQASATGVLTKIASLPLNQIAGEIRALLANANGLVGGPETRRSVASFNETLERLNQASSGVGPLLDSLRTTADAADATLRQARSTFATVEGAVGPRASLRYEIEALVQELNGAARSVRTFADYLERHPDALLRGKTGYGQ